MNRMLLCSILVACLLVLCTYHAVYNNLHEAYPGNEEVIYGAEGTVSVGGTVVHSSAEAFTLRLTHGSCSERR
jgi:archaellum component FlaF (FlaF/FlaG flagellin family)